MVTTRRTNSALQAAGRGKGGTTNNGNEVQGMGHGSRVNHKNDEHSHTQRTHTTGGSRTSMSAALVEELSEQIKKRDAQMKQQDYQIEMMKKAIAKTGLKTENGESEETEEKDDSEDSVTFKLVKKVKNKGKGVAMESTHKMFMDCKPPSFKGGEDSLVCKRWVRKINQIFDAGNYSDKQKVSYVVLLCKGEALECWESVNTDLTSRTEQMCFNCRGMGHVAAACTQAKYQPGGENKKREVGKTTARAYNMVANKKEHDDEE
ncbi:zinc finger, CCHC-type, retrotransposon gag domain protein [Tanacetum coccineum]